MRTFALAAIGALALTGAAAAETRALSGFNGVAAADPIRVEIATGSAYAVEVTGGDAARVATQVEGDTLRIFQRNRPWFGGGRRLDASVRITMPEIDAISAAHFACWLGHLAVDEHAALVDFVTGQRARLIEACGPEPFVDA